MFPLQNKDNVGTEVDMALQGIGSGGQKISTRTVSGQRRAHEKNGFSCVNRHFPRLSAKHVCPAKERFPYRKTEISEIIDRILPHLQLQAVISANF